MTREQAINVAIDALDYVLTNDWEYMEREAQEKYKDAWHVLTEDEA